MKKWSVTLPISGTIYVEVEAENEDAAIDAALSLDLTTDMIETWEAARYLVRGNVFYGETREADAMEIEE